MAASALESPSRSSSPPSSTDTPSSHSSPASADFLFSEHAVPSTWKSQLNQHNNRIERHSIQQFKSESTFDECWASDPYNSQTLVHSTPDEGVMFSEFIQEDAFDPAPLAVPFSSVKSTSSSATATAAHTPFSPHDYPQDSTFSPSHFNSQPQTMNPLESHQPPSFSPLNILKIQPSSPSVQNQPTYQAQPPQFLSSTFAAQPRPNSSSIVSIDPPKASCSNLPIIIGNVPEKGAKSRVETQIKMDLDLVVPIVEKGHSIRQRVTSWKWLRLSRGSVTKKRPKKDVKQESNPIDTLYLSTEVRCATSPNLRVYPCSNCLQREAKRVERKKASRVRPARSDSDDESSRVPQAVVDKQKQDEDREEEGENTKVYQNVKHRALGLGIGNSDEGSKIVLFNCPELLDMSKGTVSLPVRITCYCRHHREKVGFRIIFTMRDNTGRLVGRGTAPAIMITDDHKSSHKKGGQGVDDDEDVDEPTAAQTKRKRKLTSSARKGSIDASAARHDSQDEDATMDAGEADEHQSHDNDDDEEDEDDARAYKRRAQGGTGLSSAHPSAPASAANSRPGTSMGTRKGGFGFNGLGMFSATKPTKSRRGTPSRRSSPGAQPLPRSSIPGGSSCPSPENGTPSPAQALFNFSVPLSASSTHSVLSPMLLSPASLVTSPTATMPGFPSLSSTMHQININASPNPSDVASVVASLNALASANVASSGTLNTTSADVPRTASGESLLQLPAGTSSSNSSSFEMSPDMSFPSSHFSHHSSLQGQASPSTSMTSNPSPSIGTGGIMLQAPCLLPPPSMPQMNGNGQYNLFSDTAFDMSVQHQLATAAGLTIPRQLTAPAVPQPVIHRLIPGSGPMHGGIEVTILGANFSPVHECVFGDLVASSTHIWSENTIVCILPPSPSPGPVVVGFKGYPLNGPGSASSPQPQGFANGLSMGSLLGLDNMFDGMGMGSTHGLQVFTYLDNSDRALMELALQVVGLKMTGRIEEARSVAMRIVGSNSQMDVSMSTSAAGGGNQMAWSRRGTATEPHLTSSAHQSPSVSRRQSLTNLSAGAAAVATALHNRSRDFQSVLIEFLSLLDVELPATHTSSVPVAHAISHPNSSGQTLLHLAAILGFHRLISSLVSRGIDIDARDKNGYTALHFAASCGRLACARVLLEGGADTEVVECRGRSARELAQDRDQADLEALLEEAELEADQLRTRASSSGIPGSRRRATQAYDGDADDSASADGEDEGYSDSGEESTSEDLIADRGTQDTQAPHTLSRVPSSTLLSNQPSARFNRPSLLPRRHQLPPLSTHRATNPNRAQERDLYSSSSEQDQPNPSRHEAESLAHLHTLGSDQKQVLAPPGWFYRAFSQFQPPSPTTKLAANVPWALPNLPYFPYLPNLPNLPNIPLQIPDITVFPYAVPMPAWPANWQWQQQDSDAGREKSPRFRTAYDIAAGWWNEKQRPLNTPHPDAAMGDSVPMYQPVQNVTGEILPVDGQSGEPLETAQAGPSKPTTKARSQRRVGYEPEGATEEVVKYTYYSQKMRRLKHDRMLYLFWLPILLLVFAWGLYQSVPVALSAVTSTVRGYLPLSDPTHA